MAYDAGSGSGTVSSGTKGQIALYAVNGSTVSGFENAIFYPETYGAVGNGSTDDTTAIQAAINAAASNGGGIVQFRAKTYLISSSLTITTSNVSLYGITSGCTTITCNSASADIVQVTGASTFPSASNVFYNEFQDLRVIRSVSPTGTASGFHLQYTQSIKFRRVESFDSARCFWHDAVGNGLVNYKDCEAAFTATTTLATVYGWYLDGGNFGSYSSRVTDCVAENAGASSTTIYGMYLTGAYVADLYCHKFETASCTYGVYINGTGVSGGGISAYNNGNIHFVDCIHDVCATAAYYINNLYGANSYVEITGGYVAPSSGTTTWLIEVNNSSGVVMTGIDVRVPGASGAGGILITNANSTNNNINGCNFYAQSNGGCNIIGVVNSNGNAINNNTIFGYSAQAFGIGIVLVSASYNMVSGNIVSGYGTTGIYMDSGSNNNAGVNKVTPSNIGTPLSNSGAGNTVTV